eukprot:TRINITY_DN4023_c1_g1_i1.p1 TRINITY_DN4023_c1_g1~~TRINITY_DN4023_c1_g1_i1.p1  ORF type:complete len:833 (+),score=195.06 TRINITY_DN4023_c1_g1_i1:35-2533(+)
MDSTFGAISDNVAERYRARSKDDKLSQKERDAARLVVEAETYQHDEQVEKSSEKAKEGLKLFQELGDEVGVADVTRIIIHVLLFNEHRKEGNRIAKEELERIRAGPDRRGEGKMLLAVAEVNSERRGHKNRAEAKIYASEALKIFEREGDRLMQGYARICLLNITVKARGDRQESCREGFEHGMAARALFKACGDRRGEALALHSLAICHVRADISNVTIPALPGGWAAASTEAARLFKETKWLKMFVYEKVCIAQWHLGCNPEKARGLAEEAMKLCQEHKSRHEFSALNVLVQSYLAMKGSSKDFVNNEARTAIELAKRGLERFRDIGNRMGEASAMHMLVLSYQATGEKHEAKEYAAQAADIYRELGEKAGETAMLQALSQMHLEEHEPEKAFQVAQEVADMNISLHESAIARETVFEAHMQQGDLQAALKVAEDLVILCSDRNDCKREAIARLMIATVHHADQNFSEAVLTAREAQVLFHDIGAYADEGSALRTVAESYLASNHFPEALKAALWSLRLLRGKKTKDEAAALILIAQIRLSMLSQESMQRRRGSSSFATACTEGIQAADAAVSFARQAKLRISEGQALSVACQMQHSALQTDEALRTAEEAMEIFVENGDHRQQANVMCLQADAHLANNNADRALVLVNKALAIYQDIGDGRGEWMAMQILEQITGPPEPTADEQPSSQDQWTPEQWAQWNEWQQRQQSKGAGKGAQRGPPAQLQKVQAQQRQSRAVTGDKLNMSNLSVDTVRNRLNEIVKATVGLEDSETFDLDQPLMQVGITSRSAVELRNTLSDELPGVDLPFTLIFDYPSVASISDMVLDNLGGVG